MNSRLNLSVFFSIIVIALAGRDWKVKVTNNAQFDVYVQGWGDQNNEDQSLCLSWEDFEDSKLLRKDKSAFFECQEKRRWLTTCSVTNLRYMWIEIKPRVKFGTTPKRNSSYVRLEFRKTEVPRFYDCPAPTGQLANRCSSKFKGTYKTCFIGRFAYPDPSTKNLDIDIFEGELDGDHSGDECYVAVDVKVKHWP